MLMRHEINKLYLNRLFSRCQNQHQSKRQKVDKRELPENNQFFCEACDRGFKTDEKLTEHLNTHCKCNVDGCKFEAAQKLVQIHYKNVGLIGKITFFHNVT